MWHRNAVFSCMSRRIRGPVAGRLVEVTTRTMQSRFLLSPTSRANAIIKGVIGRAQERYGMALCSVVVLSTRYHLLVLPQSNRQLARFMRYLNSNIARKIGKLHGWNERFWSRRYQAIPVSDEEVAQISRLDYVLRHGCKEGLVSRPTDWPGVHVPRAGETASTSSVGATGSFMAAFGKTNRASTRRGDGARRSSIKTSLVPNQSSSVRSPVGSISRPVSTRRKCAIW